jgi:radical SAM superfamily enzyme YgiQ (UPF0313 family)
MGGTFYYPVWLAYAAGVAEQNGHDTVLMDAPAMGLNLEAVLNRLADFVPELIVLDTSTPSIINDVKVAVTLKKRFSKCFVVLVGTHPSALPVETLKLNRNIDGVCQGEYEFTIRDLAFVLENNHDISSVKGLVWQDGDHIYRNDPRGKIEELDSLPFVTSVYKKHLNIKDYFFAAASYPMVMIMSGRGCPYRCFFCVYPQVMHGRRYRMRSAGDVVAEMEYIATHLPEVKEVGFEDDCFTANLKRVREICDLILSKDLKIKWYCNVRGNLELETLQLMRQAGCRLVTVGFESGCQEILDGMKKGETVENYIKFGKAARKAGVLVHGCIMVGNPGDTAQTLAQSYEFAKKMNCDSMQFYPLYVYPGTEAYDWAVENKYLTTFDFTKWLTPEGLHNCVLNTPDLSADKMMALCDNYLRKYHFRPGYILRKAWQGLRDPEEGFRTVKSALIFFRKLLKTKSLV